MNNLETASADFCFPPLWRRLYSVWFRHFRVYTKELWSNAFPPFMEPLIFLLGIGLGLGRFVADVDGLSYLSFLATGLLVTSAMFTAAYECTYGTFIRLEFDRIYDGMLAAPLTATDIVLGEIIWTGTKGLFFSVAVTIIVFGFGIIPWPAAILAPVAGAFTGLMFGALAMSVTSIVKNINAFNFFFTGLISPLFFFSGVVFPLTGLPPAVKMVAEALPLTHPVRLIRGFAFGDLSLMVAVWDLIYILLFIVLFSFLAIKGLRRRLID